MFELRANSFLNLGQVRARVKAAQVERLAKCALIVEAEAKRILSRGGKRPGTPKLGDKKVPTVYQSGPAGQPPRLRTGNLRASITAEKTAQGTYIVGPTTTAFYGRIHEFGAYINVTPKMRAWLRINLGLNVKKDRIHIPARPFMRPALDRSIARLPEQFKDLPLGGAAGGSGGAQ